MYDPRWGDPRDRDDDPRDIEIHWIELGGDADPREDDPRARDENVRERDRDGRERDHDPRDVFVRDLDLPRGLEREVVIDGDHRYELNGDESRSLATVGVFRVVSERDLRDPRDEASDPRDMDLRHLRDEGLMRFVAVDGRERAVTLTERGHHLLEAHLRYRDEGREQAFYAGVNRPRELAHDAQLYRAYLQEEERLREQGGAASTDILHLPARVVVTTADRLRSADGPNVLEELSRVHERPMIIRMTTTGRLQQRYDHRLRDLVQGTGDVTIATDLGVPRSTARGWLRKAPKAVVSLDVTDLKASELQQEVVELRRRVKKLTALLRLALALLRSSGFTLTHERLPDGRAKIRILRAVDRAREFVPLRALLRFLRMSPSRFHAWRRRQHACALDDQSSCPHRSPHRLTPPEVRTIKDMVTALEYRHVPTGTLAVLAQRLGKVWASPSTWYHLVRKFGWRRPRLRVHPAKPKVGLRTTRADEMWHIDTTVIRLLDGTHAYLHAVIDNFSRRILAWRVANTFAPVNSVAVLVEASRGATPSETTPVVLADAGVENVNAQVDALIAKGVLRRVLAFTELKFSNSMIEAWWRSLKHQWLFLHSLDSVTTVRRLVEFYVQEHNQVLPHSAFRGQTPDEMYFGTGDIVPADLTSRAAAARRRRVEANRSASCETCPSVDAAA